MESLALLTLLPALLFPCDKGSLEPPLLAQLKTLKLGSVKLLALSTVSVECDPPEDPELGFC